MYSKPSRTYETAQAFAPNIIKFLNQKQLKLNIFVEGQTLQENPLLIKLHQDNLNSHFYLHGYHHHHSHNFQLRKNNIQKGLKVFTNYFSYHPQIYRAPNGIFQDSDLIHLKEQGFKADVSLFPFYFPGRFLHLGKKNFMHRHPTGLYIIPNTVLSFMRFPLGLSYIQLFGDSFYEALINNIKLPESLVFNFHYHDFDPTLLVKQKNLPLLPLAGYLKNAQSSALLIFKKIITLLLKKGYKSSYLLEHLPS